MTKLKTTERRLGRPPKAERRDRQLIAYVTDPEQRIADTLSGPGKPYASASDLMRAGLAMLVKTTYPEFKKDLPEL